MAVLNPKQQEAVEHRDGPLLVFAGAGSGKTRIIVYRIVHLIDQHRIAPWNILAVTFTNKAASELKERVAAMLDPEKASKINMGTFHSICARIIRNEHEQLGLISSFTIADESEQLTRVKRAFKLLNISADQMNPGDCIQQISKAKNRFISPQKMREISGFDVFARWTADVYEIYERQLEEDQTLDFDDLILKVIRLLEENPSVCEKYRSKFRYILVDEYQDTNESQYLLIRKLASKHGNLMVVGDDDQSIYGWRGADIRNIIEFAARFPGTKTVTMEQNYRSTKKILEAANALMTHNSQRAPKKLWTENEEGPPIRAGLFESEVQEAQYIVSSIQQIIGSGKAEPCDIAVFYRTNAQSRPFEEQLLRFRLPYRVSGNIGFFKRKEVKDILAYIRLILNPFDSAACLRIINVPRRGIGQGTLEFIEKIALEKKMDLFSAMETAVADKLLSHHKLEAVSRFVNIIHDLIRARQNTPLTAFVSYLLQTTGYLELYRQSDSAENQSSLEIIAEFASTAEDFVQRTRGSLADFADYLALHDTEETEDDRLKQSGSVSLMTLHNAKGLEFPYVYIAGMVDGLCPYYYRDSEIGVRDLEEERRLVYVGMTRACKELVLTAIRQRRLMGQTKYCQVSRFLKEIPQHHIQWTTPPLIDPSRHTSMDKLLSGTAAMPVFNPSIPPSTSNLQKGDRVRHPQWGFGLVIDISGSGAKTKIAIHFDRYGVKKLMLSLTQIIKVN